MKKLVTLALFVAMLLTFVSCATTPQFSLGTVDGDTYESSFIGIGFKLDEGWRYYTEAEIKEINNAAADMAGDKYLEAIKDAEVVYDMFAVAGNGTDSVNVTLEKVDNAKLGSLDVDKNYEEAAKTVKASLESMGYTGVSSQIAKVTFGGKEYSCLNITAEISGVKMYQTSVSIKCDGYLANIAACTFGENTVESVIDNFYFVD